MNFPARLTVVLRTLLLCACAAPLPAFPAASPAVAGTTVATAAPAAAASKAAPNTPAAGSGAVASEPAYGPELQGFTYPYAVGHFAFESQGLSMQMAYMDVAPAAGSVPNGATAVLLHGKNFCGATWATSIAALSQAGYRVVVPDQIGFCKSTKPAHYQYSFQQLAHNTQALLASLGVSRATIIGHSTGGMLAVRYALMYPSQVRQLVLVDPIGLEDWKAKGVPSQTVDEWYRRELQTSADGIRRYEQATYYAGHWRARYEPWVQMLAGMYRGPGRDIVAWNSALVYDMIYTQPVYYELGDLRVPTLLMIGDKDNTAIGKDLAPPAVRAQLGHYPELAHEALARIPDARLVEFPAFGHAPQMEDPQAFHKALFDNLLPALP